MEQNTNNSKKQILTNVGIFVAVFVVLLISVKFATWSASKWSNALTNEELNLEADKSGQKAIEESSDKQANVLEAFSGPSGELVLSVSSKTDDVLREIYLYNPHTESWLLVYDGYKSLTNSSSEVYRVVLDPIKFTKVRVRTLDDMIDLDKEVEIKSGSSVNVSLDL